MINASHRITLTVVGLVFVSCSSDSESPEAESTQTSALSALTFQIGEVTSTGDSDRRTTYNYDAAGRTRETQHAMNGAAYLYIESYGYPRRVLASGATELGTVLQSLQLPDGEVITYSYDSGGKRQTIRAGSDVIVAKTRRNAKSQITSIEYGNGVESEHRYDPDDLRLKQIVSTHRPAGGAPRIIQAYDYTFDEVGNTTGIRDYCNNDSCPCDPGAGACAPQQLSREFEYDTMDRLTQARAVVGTIPGFPRSYGYDAIDNLTVMDGAPQVYNANGKPHALATANNVTHNYDRNGNLTSTSAGLSLVWNPQNMPVVTTKNGQVVRKQFVDDELWQKVEAGVTTRYLPGIRIENGEMRKYYGSFAERAPEAGGALRFYHGDHLGSATLATTAAGQVVHRAAFLPFGQDDTSVTYSNSFFPKYLFNFQELEKTSALYDYGARMYNAATGRWISPDKVTADGPNRYAYVRNNPLRYSDPTGHQTKETKPTVQTTETICHKGGCFKRSTHPSDHSVLEQALDGIGTGIGNVGIGVWNMSSFANPNELQITGQISYIQPKSNVEAKVANFIALAAVFAPYLARNLKGPQANRSTTLKMIAAEVEVNNKNSKPYYYPTCSRAAIDTSIKLSKAEINHELLIIRTESMMSRGVFGDHAMVRIVGGPHDGAIISYGRVFDSLGAFNLDQGVFTRVKIPYRPAQYVREFTIPVEKGGMMTIPISDHAPRKR